MFCVFQYDMKRIAFHVLHQCVVFIVKVLDTLKIKTFLHVNFPSDMMSQRE